jgi:hypothetical protein
VISILDANKVVRTYFRQVKASSSLRDVDPLQAAFELLNSLPPMKKAGIKLSASYDWAAGLKALEISCDYTDLVPPGDEVISILDANKVVRTYFRQVKASSSKQTLVY